MKKNKVAFFIFLSGAAVIFFITNKVFDSLLQSAIFTVIIGIPTMYILVLVSVYSIIIGFGEDDEGEISVPEDIFDMFFSRKVFIYISVFVLLIGTSIYLIKPVRANLFKFYAQWIGDSHFQQSLQSYRKICKAYLQAFLSGPPYFLELPRKLWHPSWISKGFVRPVVRLHRALYGLPQSGNDWSSQAKGVLSARGWTKVADCADDVFSKPSPAGRVLLVCYVDDLLASGPSRLAKAFL